MLTEESPVNEDGGGKALWKLKSTHPDDEFQVTSQRASSAWGPIKAPEVPHWLQNIDRVGLKTSSCWLPKGRPLAGVGGSSGRGRLLWLEQCSQAPVLAAFTLPQPFGCGYVARKAVQKPQKWGAGSGGRVRD